MDLTCIICPRGCKLVTDGMNVSGNFCKRGIDYAISEFTNPVRVITTTVKVLNSEISQLPVKTNKPIPKNQIFEIMEKLKSIEVMTPIKINQVIVENIIEDVNIVSTRAIDCRKEDKNEYLA